MPEVKVLSEDLNGLGWTVKSLMDQNLEDAKTAQAAGRLSGSLGVTETGAGVSVTVEFKNGQTSIANDIAGRPTASLSGGFDELSQVISGEISPVRALLTGRIKAGGNLIKLLSMAKILITKD